jgi:nucleotide-binding universal stress UspA family protein
MFRTLMVPLDGSQQAERALPYAIRLARASGARLALVRAALGPPPSGYDWERQQLEAVGEAEAYIADVASRLTDRVEVLTATPYGEPAHALLETVQQLGVNAIVMTTHGRTGLSHLVHGSVAEAVLAHSLVPVYLVHAREGGEMLPPTDPTSARILVPLDGSAFSEAALPIALQMLGAAGELVLVSVVAPPDHVERDDSGRVRAYLDQQEESFKREAFDYLREVQAQLKQRDPDLHVTVDIRVGDPPSGIVVAEADRGADLVVMSTHGRTGLGRAMMGSVAGEVVRTGSVPVVLVGPASARTVAETESASERESEKTPA